LITVFGSINLDLIGGVDRLPRPGETVPGGAFSTSPGGKGANQAVAAARAGAPVRMVGAVGRDPFADEALALLGLAGVDLARVRQTDAPTGVALILVDPVGENVIAVLPGANATVAEADGAALEFGPGDVLLLQLEIPVAATAAAAARAKAAGAPVLLSYAPFRSDAFDLLPLATHLVVNESECELIAAALGVSGEGTAAQVSGLAERLGTTIIATLGPDGAIAASPGRMEHAPALPVQAVDTVGAGDTFCGYLAAGLSEGMPLARRCGSPAPPRAWPARRPARSRPCRSGRRSKRQSGGASVRQRPHQRNKRHAHHHDENGERQA
jgi:ribokinase